VTGLFFPYRSVALYYLFSPSIFSEFRAQCFYPTYAPKPSRYTVSIRFLGAPKQA
jgi:hypothetical protein